MWKKDIYGRVKDQMVGAELSPCTTQMIGAEPFTICSFTSTPIFFPVKTTEIVDGLRSWAIHYVQRFTPCQKGQNPSLPHVNDRKMLNTNLCIPWWPFPHSDACQNSCSIHRNTQILLQVQKYDVPLFSARCIERCFNGSNCRVLCFTINSLYTQAISIQTNPLLFSNQHLDPLQTINQNMTRRAIAVPAAISLSLMFSSHIFRRSCLPCLWKLSACRKRCTIGNSQINTSTWNHNFTFRSMG